MKSHGKFIQPAHGTRELARYCSISLHTKKRSAKPRGIHGLPHVRDPTANDTIPNTTRGIVAHYVKAPSPLPSLHFTGHPTASASGLVAKKSPVPSSLPLPTRQSTTLFQRYNFGGRVVQQLRMSYWSWPRQRRCM